MSKDNDIARIGWVTKNYDSVELLTKDGESGTSAGFKDKSGKPAPQIRYSKKINGTYYVVEAVFENDYNKLWVQSTYLSKNREDVTQVPDAADKPPEVTAKTDLPSPPSKNSLSQDVKKVNNDYIAQEANSQGENASFFDEHFEKSTPKINPDEVISGMWEDAPNTTKDIVEKSQLESVENVDENGIINYNDGQRDVFDIDSLPEQVHHFATNKNLRYTPQFSIIVSKYGLKLDQPWNMKTMKHRGKHPYVYHDYVLYRMKICDRTAKGDVDIFIQEFNKVKKKIIDNPFMLRKAFWKGKDYEILFDEV